MNPVRVTVTGVLDGTAKVIPYNHTEGLQFHSSPGGPATRPVIYTMPAYTVWIGSTKPSFKAIRFGLRNRGGTPLGSRGSDTGLSHHRVCKPTWVPGYSPHSFPGSSRRGAWRLLPGKGFLIHEGPGVGGAGGSLGCVEILDGGWNGIRIVKPPPAHRASTSGVLAT